MSLINSHSHFGGVAKTFHWLTALLILTALPLGVIAQKLPFETDAELALKATLFSAHKTVGVLAFLTALLRILWALTQKRPGLLNADNRLEATAAETVHWLLYGSMVFVPLTGWIHHAATTGFAPIWLPIGQGLPFVPKSDALATTFAGLHFVFVIVLALSILGHIGGAFKHLTIDKDQTLQRILPGFKPDVKVTSNSAHRVPLTIALCIWAVALTTGAVTGRLTSQSDSIETAALAEVSSEWAVTSGSLSIEIQQFGSAVKGDFADWTAQIAFDQTAADGPHGNVKVEVAIGSLSLGSVTQQAMGPDFFDANSFPTATFQADIFPNKDGETSYLAEGWLTLKGAKVPVTLPFNLDIQGNVASMTGSAELDRTDFAIGVTLPDETNLGFLVLVSVDLTAERTP